MNCWNPLEAFSHNVAGDGKRDGSKIRVDRSMKHDVDLVYGKSAAKYLEIEATRQVSEIKVQRPERNLVGDQGQDPRSAAQTSLSDDMVCTVGKPAEDLLTRKIRNTRQNIPRPKSDIFQIRDAFIAPPGKLLVNSDYDQLEMKLMADLSGEPDMIDAINAGRDMHCNTAALMYDVPYEAVAEAKRKDDARERISSTEARLLAYRQNAKCLVKGSLISTEEGLVPIESLVTTREEEQFNELDRVVWSGGEKKKQTTAGFYQGVRPTKKVTLKNGVEIEGSKKHRLRVINREGEFVWRRLGEMKEGDWVALDRTMRFANKSLVEVPFSCWKHREGEGEINNLPIVRITEDWASLFGYITGDGHIGQKQFSIATGEDYHEVHRHLEGVLDRLGLTYSISHATKHTGISGSMGSRAYNVWSVPIREFLLHCGVKQSSRECRVPWPIYTSPWSVVRAFLRSYFECDGWMAARTGSVGCSSASKLFLQQIQQILMNAGIFSNLSSSWNKQYERDYYKLHLYGRASFLKKVGFISSRKNEAYVGTEPGQLRVVIPHQQQVASQATDMLPYGSKSFAKKLVGVRSGSWELTEAVVDSLQEDAKLDPHFIDRWQELCKDYYYVQVSKIEDSEGELFDLSVPDGNTYVAQGALNHNTVGFGLIYGQGASNLAGQLGIPKNEAEDLIKKFFEPFPCIREFIDGIHEYVTQRGLVRTLSGRPRHLRDGVAAKGSDDMMYFQALRRAVNATIQGSAADVVRKAMILCEFDPVLNELEAQQLLQVHDELMFECPEENTAQVKKRVQELMESPYKEDLKVKLTAEPHHGYTWMEAK